VRDEPGSVSTTGERIVVTSKQRVETWRHRRIETFQDVVITSKHPVRRLEMFLFTEFQRLAVMT
jgi:hypothetical protein